MSARLFVALEVSEEDRSVLADWALRAIGDDPGLRPVAAENLHLTLAFLGHRSLAELDDVAALIEDFAPGEPPQLETAGALWLSPRRPHVLTVAVADPSRRLGRLHERLWDELEAVGLPREERPFRPHITVARIRRGWGVPRRELEPAPLRPLTPQGIVLYLSYLGRGVGGGPAYEPQARVDFAVDS